MSDITPTTRDDYTRCSAAGNHSLDDIVGYEVWQTIDQHGRLIDDGKGRLVLTVEGAGNYGRALQVAQRLRRGEGYGVVENVHACGHSSADWDGRTVWKEA